MFRLSPRLSEHASEVRRLDHDRFLCALFASEAEREDLFALYAFNQEVARIRETVSEPLIGQMRLQWWRDVMDAIYTGDVPRHPIALSLAEAVRRHDLTRTLFDRLIDARADDLDDNPPPDTAALVTYAEGTSATLTALSLEVLGQRNDVAEKVGHNVGVAWALIGLLRSVPFHAGRGRIYLPARLMRERGLDASDLFRRRSGPTLTAVVSEVAQEALRFLAEARHLAPVVPRRALPALLPATLADGYLKRLGRAGYNPFDEGAQVVPVGRLVQLAFNAYRGRY
jgi:NADH dehydrogenase [ubiquinone] 1 alpha subcomplex assembly factor 6